MMTVIFFLFPHLVRGNKYKIDSLDSILDLTGILE